MYSKENIVEILDKLEFETPVELGTKWFMRGKPDPKYPQKIYYTAPNEEDLSLVYKEIQDAV